MLQVVSISQQLFNKQSQRLWRLCRREQKYGSSDCQHDNTQPNHVTSWSELEKRRLISSFHQTDLTEIQVINKSIKGLNTRTIYRTFKAINENKGIQRRLGSGRNSSISKSNFEIIKKCLEINNSFSTFELSKYLQKKESK